MPPVPLPARPAALVTEVDLLLRQLATPPATLGGAELTDRLRAYYAALKTTDDQGVTLVSRSPITRVTP